MHNTYKFQKWLFKASVCRIKYSVWTLVFPCSASSSEKMFSSSMCAHCALHSAHSAQAGHWPSRAWRHPQKKKKVLACAQNFIIVCSTRVQKENLRHSWPCHPMLGVLLTNLFCTKVNSVKLWRSSNTEMVIECIQRYISEDLLHFKCLETLQC